MSYPINVKMRQVLLPILISILVSNCDSSAPGLSGNHHDSRKYNAAGLQPGPTNHTLTDSLLETINSQLRKRQLNGLDSLIGETIRILNEESHRMTDSLRWAHYYRAQSYRISLLRELGDFDGGLALWEQEFPNVVERFGDRHALVAGFYNTKSAYYLYLSKLDSSKFYANRAIEILTKNEVSHAGSLMGAHMRLAHAANQEFNMFEAMTHSERAIDYARRSTDGTVDSVGLGATYNLRAGAHYTFQEYEQTLEYLEKAFEMTAANPFWEATYKMNVAGVHIEVGNLDTGLGMTLDARQILKTLGTIPQEYQSIIDYNLGIIYMDMQEYDSAAVYLDKMLNWREKHTPQQKRLIATNQNSLAHVYTEQGRLSEAETLFDKSHQLYNDLLPSFHPEWIRHKLILSSYYKYSGEIDRALDAANYVLNSVVRRPGDQLSDYDPPVDSILFKDHALRAFVQKSSLLLSKASSGELVYLDRCLNTVSAAIDLVDQMRTDYQLARFRRLLNQNAREIFTIGVQAAIARYHHSGNLADLELAFEYSTRSKGGMLRDIQRELNAREFAGIPDSLRTREQALQTRIWRTEVMLSLLRSQGAGSGSVKIKAVEDTLHTLWVELGNFKRRMQESEPSYRKLMYTAPSFSIHTLRDGELGKESVVLDVFNDEDHLHMFLVRQDTIVINSVAFDDQLETSLSIMREKLGSGKIDYTTFVEHSHTLYTRLISPLEDLLASTTLIVIPDKAVYGIPFSALLTSLPANSGLMSYADLAYLVKKHPIRNSYSASLLDLEPHSFLNDGTEQKFLAYAPGFMGELLEDSLIAQSANVFDAKTPEASLIGPLPFSKEEVEQIRDIFVSHDSSVPLWVLRILDRSSDLRVNGDATESQLLSDELSTYDYVHFSTHGFFDQQSTSLAGLLLYPDKENDGILLPGDIYRLKLNARLVVLSACHTGLGEWTLGEGLIGPAQAFLQAGAQNLLVTLWQTENRSAAQLMPELYSSILAGKSYAEALQQAQLAMLETEDYQHPRYWSPFMLIGR